MNRRGLERLWSLPEEPFRTLIEAHMAFRHTRLAAGLRDEAPLLGDSLIASPDFALTRSGRIALPPCGVWPWLVQLLRGGGVYGCPMLETPGSESADYVLPGLPLPRPGDALDGLLRVAAVVPGREIVWTAPGGLKLIGFWLPQLTLDYSITPWRSECLLRTRVRGTCDHVTAHVQHYLISVLDYTLLRHQLERIKAFAESYEGRWRRGETNESPGRRHQALSLDPARRDAAALAEPLPPVASGGA